MSPLGSLGAELKLGIVSVASVLSRPPTVFAVARRLRALLAPAPESRSRSFSPSIFAVTTGRCARGDVASAMGRR